MVNVTNNTPGWKSYMATGNAADIVSSPTVATAIGTKVDAVGGEIGPTTSAYGTYGSTSVAIGRLISDYEAMRSFACPLVGTSGNDDLPGLQAMVDAAVANNINGVPRLDIIIPPGTDIYLSAPLDTKGCWTTIRGAGMYSSRIIMASGAAGAIVHGTSSSKATNPIQIENVGFWDSNGSGSGVPAISAYFDYTQMSAMTALVMTNVFFRYFSQALIATDVPRDAILTTCISYAPDNTITSLSAFKFVGSDGNTHGCYTFIHDNCRQVNHLMLFDYYSDTQLEGVRITNCTSYGGGMVRAYMSPTPSSLSGVTTYQSPIWYITNCDWQGQGPAIDLYRCSDVVITRGFTIADELATTVPANVYTDPAGNSRSFRAHMWFEGCDGVYLDRVRMDTLSTYEAGACLCYVSSDTTYFEAEKTLVQSSTTADIYGFYYQSGGNNNRCAAMNTKWIVWNGGNKIYDPSGTQIEQEAVYDPANNIYYGNVDISGRYNVQFKFDNQTANSSNQITFTYPTPRQNGKTLFNGSAPFPFVSVYNGTGATAPGITVVAYSTTGCTIALEGTSSSYEGDYCIALSGY